MTQRKTFTLDDERDAAIIARLDAEPNASDAIRQALREHYGLDITLRDIYNAIQQLNTQPVATTPATEEPDLADALDNLGL